MDILKTILFVVDYDMNSPNSVGKMLKKIVTNEVMNSYKKVIFCCNDNFDSLSEEVFSNNLCQIKVNNKNSKNITFYKRNVISSSVIRLLSYLTSRLRFGGFFIFNLICGSNLRIVIKRHHVDYILFFTVSPMWCSRFLKTPCSYFLYDTFLERPNIKARLIRMEKKIIQKCVSYYLSPFFYPAYNKKYPFYEQIKSLPYPIYPDLKAVINAFHKKNNDEEIQFGYFGQLQAFRNVDEIVDLFSKLGWIIDIFSWNHPMESPSVRYHMPVYDDAYYKSIALSKFLLVFDNNEPYSHYLPSKIYELIAFSKPIIVFGKNDSSATKSFLEKYPYYKYFDLRNEDVSKTFKEYIMGFNEPINFNFRLYEHYNKMYSTNRIVGTIIDDFNKYGSHC